jgi:hypothetical protein
MVRKSPSEQLHRGDVALSPSAYSHRVISIHILWLEASFATTVMPQRTEIKQIAYARCRPPIGITCTNRNLRVSRASGSNEQGEAFLSYQEFAGVRHNTMTLGPISAHVASPGSAVFKLKRWGLGIGPARFRRPTAS